MLLFFPSSIASSLASIAFINIDSVCPASLDEKCLGFFDAFSLPDSNNCFL